MLFVSGDHDQISGEVLALLHPHNLSSADELTHGCLPLSIPQHLEHPFVASFVISVPKLSQSEAEETLHSPRWPLKLVTNGTLNRGERSPLTFESRSHKHKGKWQDGGDWNERGELWDQLQDDDSQEVKVRE